MRARCVNTSFALASILMGANGAVKAAPPDSGGPDTIVEPVTIPDKSGSNPTGPLEIHLSAENDPGAAESAGLKEFARLVKDMSGGQISVTIKWQTNLDPEVWDANPGPVPTTHDVVTGASDMGFAGNNYWAYEGVESTRPANAPLAIRSVDQALAVTRDTELVNDLFAGLSDIGIVGLQMFPQNFKVLVDFHGPVTKPDDLKGLVLRSRAAPELFDYYAALGTKAQQDNIGFDLWVSPTWLAKEWLPGVAVGNLPVHFSYFDLFANARFWKGLSDHQHDVIAKAALQARDYVIDHLPESGSVDALRGYCDRGSVVTWLGGDGVEAFEAAAKPVIDAMRSDPVKADLLDRIAKSGEGDDPTIYPACDGTPPAAAGASAIAIPNGVYRFEITDDDLQRVGIPADQWEFDTGVYTFKMTDGSYTWAQQSPTRPQAEAASYEGNGEYTGAGGRVIFNERSFGDPVTFEVSPTVDSDGSLRWKVVDADRNFVRFLFGEPWIRIGDA